LNNYLLITEEPTGHLQCYIQKTQKYNKTQLQTKAVEAFLRFWRRHELLIFLRN